MTNLRLAQRRCAAWLGFVLGFVGMLAHVGPVPIAMASETTSSTSDAKETGRGDLEREVTTEPRNIPLAQFGRQYRLVGELHVPLGEVVTIEGVVVDGQEKGYEGGRNLRVQRIQGQATQEDIQIVVRPFLDSWGEIVRSGRSARPELVAGATYEMVGYETGEFVGVPRDAFRKGAPLVQTTGFYFRERFIVIKATPIEPIAFAPDMFGDEPALIQGLAESRDGKGVLVGNEWSVIVLNDATWPKDVEGKQIETWGRYRADAERNGYTLLDGEWRLVRLEDQVGRDVKLQGKAFSLNGVWWFQYRGADLYVEDMEHLPGWTGSNHGRAIEVKGRLETALLPRLDQIALKPDRDLREYFIVRNATWKAISSLSSPERPFPKISEKVIERNVP